jgi:hypothetical protein
MERVIAKLTSRCYTFTFWYKFYANDLVLCVNHTHLQVLLTALYTISDKFDLRINPKKSAIFLVRGHSKIIEETYVKEIPINTEYLYLGVMLDHSGRI